MRCNTVTLRELELKLRTFGAHVQSWALNCAVRFYRSLEENRVAGRIFGCSRFPAVQVLFIIDVIIAY